jgi:hypothetical protein
MALAKLSRVQFKVPEDKPMVKPGGQIRPLQPLPADWREGQPLCVEMAGGDETPVEQNDRDCAVSASLCEGSAPAEDEQLDRALQEGRRQGNEQVARGRV